MEKLIVINIKWEKIEFNFDIIRKHKENCDYGIYQIYGHHPSYGNDTLLYIGKAQDNTFGVRLDNREEFLFSSCRPTYIRLGRFLESETEELGWDKNSWGEFINIAEKMLIKAHPPAFNQQENKGLFEQPFMGKDENFLIINWEDYGRLSPEVSSLRISNKYWSFDKYVEE